MIEFFFKGSHDERLKTLKEPLAGCWINVVAPNEKEKKFLEGLGIPRGFVESSLDFDEQPRVDSEGRTRLIILQAPKVFEGNLETVPLGIVLVKNFIVTISPGNTNVLRIFKEGPRGFYTTKRARFILQIFWMTVRSYLSHLKHIDRFIDDIDERIIDSLENKEVFDLLRAQRTLTYFKSALTGNQRVLDKLMSGKFIRLYEQDEDVLEDIMIDNRQALEMVNMYLDILTNTMDAYASIVNNNMNIVIRILTIVSIAMAIPNIVSGFYGMNISLPMQHSSLAFATLVSSSLLASVLVFVLLRRARLF